MYYSLNEFHLSSSNLPGQMWLWFLYYNNICDVIVNDVNQLKE